LVFGITSSIAVTCTSPLDVLKIRFQTQNELQISSKKDYPNVIQGAKFVIQNEGIRGLYKGLSVSVLREMTFTSFRFALYEPFRYLFSVSGSEQGTGVFAAFGKIFAGLCSGAVAAALFNPTDVLKIRFQADQTGTRYKSVIGAFKEVISQEGKVGLYKGVGTTTIRAALLTSAQLASYDHCKHTLLKKYNLSDNFTTHFCASMFSGFMTSLVTNPVDVVRTRIMNEKAIPNKARQYSNLFSTLWQIFRIEGARGLYKGFVPSYIRLGLCTVIGLVLSETIRAHILGIPTL